MLKLLTITLIAVALVGCSGREVGKVERVTASDSNSTIQIEELFTHDGIKVYAFYNGDRMVYFSRPVANFDSSTVTYISNGKTVIPVTTRHQTLAVDSIPSGDK